MLCEWLKCTKPAVILFCDKPVCNKHIITIDSIDVRESRRILNAEDLAPASFKLIGVRGRACNKKRKTAKEILQ